MESKSPVHKGSVQAPPAVQVSLSGAQGVEATLYSALMSVANAAGGLGSLLGAGLTWALGITATQFKALPALVGICALSGLLPLPLLRFVPRSSSASQPAEIQL